MILGLTAQSVEGDNPWIDCAKRGSEVRAMQSADSLNPNFAPNIYMYMYVYTIVIKTMVKKSARYTTACFSK